MSNLAYKHAVERDTDRQILATGFNLSVCENCGHDLREQLPEKGAQLWACQDCGSMRQWGFFQPGDKHEKPALECDQCGTSTRHSFIGVSGRLI